MNKIYGTFNLCIKALLKSPKKVSSVVTLMTMARFSKIFSFILPLKTLLIIQSEHVPNIITSYFPTLSYQAVAVLLFAFTLISYMTHILSLKYLEPRLLSAASDIENLVDKASDKIKIFPEILSGLRIISQSLSLIFIYLILIIATIYLHPSVAKVILASTLLLWLILIYQLQNSRIDQSLDPTPALQQKLRWGVFVSHIALVFFIIYELVQNDSTYEAATFLISFLLARYAIQCVSDQVCFSSKVLYSLPKLSMLFLDEKVEEPSGLDVKKTIKIDKLLIHKILQSALNKRELGIQIQDIRFSKLSAYGVHCFQLDTTSKNGSNKKFYAKIYSQQYKFLSEHEFKLLNSLEPGILHPRVLLMENYQGFRCVLCEGGEQVNIDPKHFPDAATKIIAKMWSIPSTNKALDAFGRTDNSLLNTITSADIEILDMSTADERERCDINRLATEFVSLKDYVLQLPLALHNQDLNMKNVILNSKNDCQCFQWGRWSLEPIGVSLWKWISILNDEQILAALKIASLNRCDCNSVSLLQIKLSASLMALVKHIQKKNFYTAKDVAIDVITLFDRIKAEHESKNLFNVKEID